LKKTRPELPLPLFTVCASHALYTWWFMPGPLFHAAALACDILFVAVWMLTAKTPQLKRARDYSVQVTGVTPQMLAEAIDEGSKKKERLASLGKTIEDEFVKITVSKIVDVIQEILDDIEKDPKDLKLAKKFLSYYLDTTITITAQYISLSQQKVRSAEMRESLDKTGRMLEKMHHAFRQQLTHLLEDDVMDLNTELELLDKTIKAEGYDNEK